MGVLDETRFVERMKFFNGQRLFAADLQGVEAFNREMRWLHNQSLHQPGIGRGFAVSGFKGDRQVTIGPGYAIDARGREIVLTQPQVLQVPPVSTDKNGQSIFFALTVSYPEDTDLEEAELRLGLCDTRGAVRLQEMPIFCWVPLERDELGSLHATGKLNSDIQQGMKIVLGRVEVLNCRLQHIISIAQRQPARPDCGPHIACGIADPEWRPKLNENQVADLVSKEYIAFTAVIDTSKAGFRITPRYSAHIPGPRIVEETLLIDFLRILDVQLTSFTVLLLICNPFLLSQGCDDVKVGRKRIVDWIINNWKVTWMGVEG